jgi:hypothetical protein
MKLHRHIHLHSRQRSPSTSNLLSSSLCLILPCHPPLRHLLFFLSSTTALTTTMDICERFDE